MPGLAAGSAGEIGPSEVREEGKAKASVELRDGAIVRGPTQARRLALMFTAHEFAEGGDTILDALAQHKAKAAFFLTGDFLRNTNFAPLIERLVREGHYLGPHSDKHLLLCSFDMSRRTLLTRPEFEADVRHNLRELHRVGAPTNPPPFFLPPYEHFNRETARWTRALGLTLINFTPGTRSVADYTLEKDRNFVSAQRILDNILRRERDDPHGLNGFLLLLHVGAGPGRADKMHRRFPELLEELTKRGYEFVRVDELLATP
ncbi:MAG: polysaccharide deacetylase family protein [Verrucomicrobia bacterium]|nr:polysaccharide deacetylase family protein [Verrucomicrobiota bacterium]